MDADAPPSPNASPQDGAPAAWRWRPDPRLILLAWPVIAAWRALVGDHHMIGHPGGEGLGHVWVTWALVDTLGLPGNAVSAPPDLAWVFPTDLTSRLLTMALRIPFGDVTAYNLVTMALLAFAGWMVAVVAEELGLGRWPATAAGLFAAAHPALLGYAADGRQDSLALGWAALLLHAWLRCVRAPSLRAGAWLASTVLLLQLSSPNYLLAMAVPLVPASCFVLARRAEARRALIAAAVLSTLTTGPAAYALLHFDARAGTRLEADFVQGLPLVERMSQADWKDSACGACAGWRGAFRMDAERAAHDVLKTPTILERAPEIRYHDGDFIVRSFAPGARRHVGIVIGALALAGVVVGARGARAAALLAGMGLLLALGYGVGNALPFSVPGVDGLWVLRVAQVAARVPGLSVFGNYGIFGVLAHAALGVAAAGALDAAAARWRRPSLIAVVGALAWGVELQTATVTPLPLAASRVPTVADLGPVAADTVQKDGVLLVHRNMDLDRYIQTLHGHDIYSPWFNNEQRIVTSHAAAAFLDRLEAVRCPTSAREGTIRALRADGVRWILVAPELLTREHREDQIACLDAFLGAPTGTDAFRVYETPALPGAPLGDPPESWEGPRPKQGPQTPPTPIVTAPTAPAGPMHPPPPAKRR